MDSYDIQREMEQNDSVLGIFSLVECYLNDSEEEINEVLRTIATDFYWEKKPWDELISLGYVKTQQQAMRFNRLVEERLGVIDILGFKNPEDYCEHVEMIDDQGELIKICLMICGYSDFLYYLEQNYNNRIERAMLFFEED